MPIRKSLIRIRRLYWHLRAGLEWQVSSELSDRAANLRAESLVAEQAAYCAAERLAHLPEQIAEKALRSKLAALELLRRLELLRPLELLRIQGCSRIGSE